MEKVRIGNDMRVNFSVYRNGQPESFDGASNISTKLVNEAYNKEITHTYTIAGNVVQLDIDALQLTQCGKCRLFISYTKAGDYTVDSPAFELVNYTDQTGGTEIIGVEIVSINISGDIGINRDGLSAYEVWESYPGNEGKTIEQYFLWLRENPTKIDLDGLNSNIDKLHFKPDTLVQLTNIGDVRYSPESKTLEVKVSDTVSIQLGQEMQIRVKNDEAIQINNGQMVYINSAVGANPLAKIASTSNADIAQRTFGMATENIAANGFGAITTEGLVRDINTSAFPEGAMLWLGTNGSVTNIEPTAPTSKISVGMVLRSNANNGVVYVKIRAIARNQKLSDVYAPTLTTGDILRWNNTALRFEVYNLSNKADLVGGKVPSEQLPAYVDDVLEYANFAAFPVTGESGKIYVDLQYNLTYRWGGSAYTEISKSLALGETSTTAYRGDRGKTAYDHSQLTGNAHGTTAGQIPNTPAGTISATTVQAAINELDGDIVQVETDLNGLFISGKNKYNPKNGLIGSFYINRKNGDVAPGYGSGVTDYIKITQAGLICNKAYIAGVVIGVAVYDSNKTFIRGVQTRYVTYLEGDFYVRFTLIGDLSDCQVEDGVISTSYEPYKQVIIKDYLPAQEVPDLSISTNKIVDYAVTENKTCFFNTNLANPSEFTDGHYVNNVTGVLEIGVVSTASGYIPVSENTRYYTDSFKRLWACYDKNKVFTHGGSSDSINYIDTLENDAYVRYTSTLSSVNFKYLSEDNKYTPYGVSYLKPKYTPSFTNDICLPSKLYMLSDTQNDVFVEPFIKRWNPYKYDVAFDGTALYMRKLQRVVSISGPVEGKTIIASLYDTETFDKITTRTSVINVGIKSVGEIPIKVQIIGDSITSGAFFKDALLTKGYVPNINMIGLRKVIGTSSQYDEGRSGWTLSDYFTIPKTGTLFHGFMQPNGNYWYWGAVEFWVNAWKVFRGTAGSAPESTYSCNRYDDYLSLFDESTGYIVTPKVGDIMYSVLESTYKLYDGTSWVSTTEVSYTWSFDYGKYLSMWNLNAPDILVEFLGVNDFWGGNLDQDYTLFNQRIIQMKDSYISAVPNGKFVVLIHISTVGNQNNNNSGVMLKKYNAAFWNSRKNLIDTFDNREGEGIYIVDAGVLVDNDFGFNISSNESITKPYSEYGGTERIKVQTGNPHPYVNYPSIGIPLAAFIQKYRS